MNLKEIHYGIEIETVKRTREQIAWAIHSVVGGTVRHVGIPSSYDPWEVEDLRGRVWKVVGDASLTSVPAHLRAEVVSPVLGYDDIPQLQEAVRAIRRAGGKINSQCGIHIHIDAAPFDGRHLGNLAKIIYKQEPLILHALGQRRADPAHRTASPPHQGPAQPHLVRLPQPPAPTLRQQPLPRGQPAQRLVPGHGGIPLVRGDPPRRADQGLPAVLPRRRRQGA